MKILTNQIDQIISFKIVQRHEIITYYNYLKYKEIFCFADNYFIELTI